MDNKLQMIRMKNVNGDDLIEIEIIASRMGNMPAISKPEFNGDVALELFYGENEHEILKNGEVKSKLDRLIEDGIIKFNEKTYKHPRIKYEDITEKLLLGSKPIKMESLKSQEHGLWAMSGRRKFEISFDNIDCFTEDEFIKETDIRIVFNKLNGRSCGYQDFCTEESIMKGKKTIIELDTDMFDNAFKDENENKKHIKCSGYIEVICQYGHGQEIRYKYPIELYVINTNPNIYEHISETPASIDFGTSSTCVAIERNNRYELLTLSPMEKEDDEDDEVGNIYENPTNIMVFDWDSLYLEWRNENLGTPIVSKGRKSDYLKYSKNTENSCKYKVEFDSGYSVKSILGSDDTERKELNAILTLIKMIPYQILEEEQQLEINPFNDKDKFINIVCDVEKENETCFNPVAFYGYLIGRAINDISKHDEIYTKFWITSPVMFDDTVKEVLRSSLEYGLSRAVPKKLRECVEVEITHTEPVAYIGSLCGTEYFQIEEDEQKMFAVFDFGGGTLDFSYGIASNEEDLKIEVVKVGGRENFGGETLIERLAYQIYLYNSVLKENAIPFIQPYGEELPDDIEERLVKKSDYAKANMNIVSAKIARRIFEGKMDANGEAFKNLELYNMDGERKEFKVNYDISELEEKLREIITDSVNDFAVTLKDAFEKIVENFDVNDVYIFKAGNSSRNKYVDEGMKANFPNNKHIQLVDQSAGTGKSKRYSITPKTAVAIGQLKLNRIEVVGDNDFFKFYVGFFNEGTGKFKIVLDRTHNDGIWHKFRKVKNNELDIQYATSKPSDSSTVSRKIIKASEHKGENIFIRIKDETTIEYCFTEFNDAFLIKDETIEIFELDLK